MTTATAPAAPETATVDLTATNEHFADYKLSPVDTDFLDVIQAHLTKLGLSARLTDEGTVQAVLTQLGQPYALGIFVSAREVFYRDAEIDDQVSRGRNLLQALKWTFDRKQAHWVGDTKTTTKLATYLFVVRDESAAHDPQFDPIMLDVELNMYHAPKRICWLGELDQVTRPAFTPVAHRAHEQPTIHCGRASFNEFDKPFDYVGTVTRPFKPQDHASLVEQLAARGNRTAIMKLTEQLFRSVMGIDYRLVEGDGWPEVARGPAGVNDWSMPAGVGMLSQGEETVLTFCLFLALAHDAVEDGMVIGVRESLNRVDPNRQFKAFDLLRDFIAATGASVCYQTDKSECIRLAESRMKVGVALASQAKQYR
jgi:hypothetical protein